MATRLGVPIDAFRRYRSGQRLPHHRRMNTWSRALDGRWSVERLRDQLRKDRLAALTAQHPRSSPDSDVRESTLYSVLGKPLDPQLTVVRAHEMLSRYVVRFLEPADPHRPRLGARRPDVLKQQLRNIGSSAGVFVSCLDWHHFKRRIPARLKPLGVPVLAASVAGPVPRGRETEPLSLEDIFVELVRCALTEGFSVYPLKLRTPRLTYVAILFGTSIILAGTKIDIHAQNGDRYVMCGQDILPIITQFLGVPPSEACVPRGG